MSAHSRILTTGLLEHPAVRAWGRLSPGRVDPRQVAILKRKAEGAVYRLVGVGPGGGDVIAKRCAAAEATVERAMYEEILPRLRLPTIAYHGCIEESEDCSWIFLQDTGGVRYSPDVPEHRAAAARWLAHFHASVSPGAAGAGFRDRGPVHYGRVLRSIVSTLPQLTALATLPREGSGVLQRILARCERLETQWSDLQQSCADLPRSVVHGDCLPKNAHVRLTSRGPVFAPFDWGGMGIGLAATDLGTLGLPRRGPPDDPPDCASYLSVARERWPRLELETVEWLANLGQLFWSLKVIHRCLPEFQCDWARPEDVISNYRIYAAALERAMRALA